MATESIRTAPQDISGLRRRVDVLSLYLLGIFVLGVLVQVFLAGRGAFGIMQGEDGFAAHRAMGNALALASILLAILSLIARPSIAMVVGTVVLGLLTEVGEHALADGGHSHVWLGALHALDGVLILLLAIALVIASLRRTGRRLDPWQSRLLR